MTTECRFDPGDHAIIEAGHLCHDCGRSLEQHPATVLAYAHTDAIEKARDRVVEAAKAWVNTYWRTADHDNDLTSAVAELERLEAEAQP